MSSVLLRVAGVVLFLTIILNLLSVTILPVLDELGVGLTSAQIGYVYLMNNLHADTATLISFCISTMIFYAITLKAYQKLYSAT